MLLFQILSHQSQSHQQRERPAQSIEALVSSFVDHVAFPLINQWHCCCFNLFCDSLSYVCLLTMALLTPLDWLVDCCCFNCFSYSRPSVYSFVCLLLVVFAVFYQHQWRWHIFYQHMVLHLWPMTVCASSSTIKTIAKVSFLQRPPSMLCICCLSACPFAYIYTYHWETTTANFPGLDRKKVRDPKASKRWCPYHQRRDHTYWELTVIW